MCDTVLYLVCGFSSNVSGGGEGVNGKDIGPSWRVSCLSEQCGEGERFAGMQDLC